MSEGLPAGNAEDLAGADEAGPQPWSARVAVATRVLAGLQLVKGLMHWALLLGIADRPGRTFETESSAWQGTMIYFAIVDLVAAVGLWMAAPWGVVLWLFAAISQLVVFLVLPELLGRLWFVLIYEVLTLAGYGYLSLRAHWERTTDREREP